MQRRTRKVVWDKKKVQEKLEQLAKPGVIGFFNSVEITEVLGAQDNKYTNFLTLAVLESPEVFECPDWKSVILSGRKRIRLPGTEWNVAIVQYRLSLEIFLQKVAAYAESGEWKPSPFQILTGKLVAVPPQFVPSDGSQHHPWNGILKNNFFEGSHVLEFFDTTKEHIRFLLDDSRRLTNLANIVGEYLPIKIDGMSDRLGNVIIQLPVTAMSARVRGTEEGGQEVTVAWHPDVAPRSVNITAEILADSTVTSFDSAVVSSGTATLQLNELGGGATNYIWDNEHRLLLGATFPMKFFTAASFSISVSGGVQRDHAVRREFLLPEFATPQSVDLKEPEVPQRIIGSTPERPREPWVSQRVFSESVVSLKERKEFVQYGRDGPNETCIAESQLSKRHSSVDDSATDAEATQTGRSGKLAKRMAALGDLWWLMEAHGSEGVWLWDPFLTADDVLRTLFFCRHIGVPLRALTAGKTPTDAERKLKIEEGMSEREIEKLAWERDGEEINRQRVHLENAKGNCHGLQLEFRIRRGNAGWGFHDRFLIFPRAQGSAFAWSLGTSINSFGHEHHILQKVSHGEPIAQAFEDLWESLEGPDYLIWKTPETQVEEKA